MQLSILIPVLNEAENLPRLFRALKAEAKRASFEVLFIDNGSTDGSISLLSEFKKSQRFPVVLLKEKRKGFAPPINKGVHHASSDYFATLDADATPEPGWAKAMLNALKKYDIAVGNTVTRLKKTSTEAERSAAFLFKGFSKRAAEGKSHALPWGPTCNLGFRRSTYQAAGAFDANLGSAFDIAWCWKAVQAGLQLGYAPRAKVNHQRRKHEHDFLKQMYRYGTGEAKLTAAFITKDLPSFADSQTPAIEAYARLRKRMGQRPLAKKTAAAFASGVAAGYKKIYQGNLSPQEKH